MTRSSGALGCLLLVVHVALLGCGRSDGPRRYEVSGRVTFQGEPVPVGLVQFVPDTSQDNHGPATSAAIEDGRFRTPRGKGIVGGPHVVIVTGSDGVPFDSPEGIQSRGKALFPAYRHSIVLPHESSEQDFEVPPP